MSPRSRTGESRNSFGWGRINSAGRLSNWSAPAEYNSGKGRLKNRPNRPEDTILCLCHNERTVPSAPMRSTLVRSLCSMVSDSQKRKARQFLLGLSTDELQYIAEFFGL